MTILARMWAGAREAAGCDELSLEGPTLTLAQVAAAVASQAPDPTRAAAVLAACSVLIGDRPVSSQDPDQVLVSEGETVEFLPPFAGG